MKRYILTPGLITLLLGLSLPVGLGGTAHRLSILGNLTGFHDVADCQVIAGWAWDSDQPNSPISVNIYDGTTLIATVTANLFRQDLLNAGIGNGNHGFSIATPASLKDGQSHSIRVKFSGTSTDLFNTPETINCGGAPPALASLHGFHDSTSCQLIAGWAWDSDLPDSPINVDIYDGTTVIATVTANIFRQDLLNAGIGNGNHGFSIATPESLKDGQSHSIRVKFSGTSTDLFTTPKTINCGGAPPAPASSEGFHDVAGCQLIAGWAWDANQPNSPIDVDIYDGTTVIATVTANKFRQDLVNAGKGNGNHGFSIDTPATLKNGQPHSVRVKFSGTSTDLFTTPKTITCSATPIFEGHLVLSAPIDGFDRPVYATGAGDGSNRLFVVDQVGRIYIVKNGTVMSTPFLDISNRVRDDNGNGWGLMSLAFPPGYAGKGHFYVYYMNLSGNPEVARFRITANPDVADADTQQVVLTVTEQVGPGHIGGHIAFSPRDGYLYLAVGDGEPGERGSEGDPLNRAQDPAQLRGKMLRIDVETANPATYTIPTSNPFMNRAGYRPEIWALGLRNPWRFSFDRQTGDLYIGDNGQDLYEEVDFQPASSAGGENYGWRIMEGNHCYVPPSGCSPAGLTLPVLEFAHTSSCASVIGGFVYRGSSVPGLQGIYLYLDYCSGKISGMIRKNNSWQSMLLLETNLLTTFASFGEDEEGNFYVLGRRNGSIYKIQATM